MNFKAPRGTHDIFGINVKGISELEKGLEIFAKHAFEEIRTPILKMRLFYKINRRYFRYR